MQKIELNHKENDIVKKTGFYIKQVLSSYDYFTTLFSHISFYTIGILFLISLFTAIYTGIEGWLNVKIPTFFNSVTFNIFYYLFFGGILGLWIYITYKYSIFKYGMVRLDGSIIINKSIYTNISDIPLGILLNSKKINSIGESFLKSIRTPIFFGYKKGELEMTVIGIWVWIALICASLLLLLFSILAFLIGIFLVYMLRYIIALNSFLSIGFHLQKITPEIKIQSKKIQSEFQSDMNFGDLHNGFDSLSHTFSEIISLVLRLERVEKRANKGNLFDSEKYINSLRGDIVESLEGLKAFLEEQQSKLKKSQQELSQIRVGTGADRSQSELQSTRSERLSQELTETIGELGSMIEKMR